MNKKVIIISYTFPPNNGIGGRRWAKFAKYLHRNNYDVKVITTEQEDNPIGIWSEDIEELRRGNRIVNVPSNFPVVLNSFPETIIKKIEYRFALFYMRQKVKGNYYDRSSLWKTNLLTEVKYLIGKGYLTIFATGAPFHYLNDIVKLKKRYPNLKVIVDFRDPWVWGKGYGVGTLNKERLDDEYKIQENVISSADFVLVPVSKMQSDLMEFYPLYEDKIRIIGHGYDNDDMPKNIKHRNRNKRPLKLIYTGTVYDQLDLHFVLLNKALIGIEESELAIDFYVTDISNNKKYFDLPQIKRISHIFSSVKPKIAMQKIDEADYFLAIYPDKFKDHISTKFPELVRLEIPIIYIGKKGKISDFILSHGLGIHIEVEGIRERLPPYLKGEKIVPYNPKLNAEVYSLERITEQLIGMI